ncbi:2-oxo-4-hydroxy-4-carboxy-5-ureidoimidazoline decarboxylase [Saccharopolyspora halophila]|uniref:2-oxo-4-hydroxy-4-carboxy-5-ureidoimidazoline decarboxylase n=1 Tax=Saccharopolyspora halophila TaxID=405551 RepID=A0ABN3FIY0_9PSEU
MPDLNALAHDELVDRLLACMNVPRWAEDIAAARPYATSGELLNAADEAAPDLTTDEIHRALSAHPRIGEQPRGENRDARFSRSEQAGVGDELAEELRAANAEYERRFDHVYLVCASGRTGEELLAILRSRLNNDPDTELGIVAEELRKIARIRLEKVIDS